MMRARGFTLAELLVGLVVTSIVMIGVASSVIGVQNSYQAETEVKVVSENGRTALTYAQNALALAGYGIDPRLAFDVNSTLPGGHGRENFSVSGAVFTPGQPALVGTVITDDLAFRYREPSWLAVGRLNAGHTTLTVDAPLGVPLPLGKLLLLGCRGGVETLFVRVATAAVASDTSVTVTAQTATPFVDNANNCLTGTGANSPYVFMVHEQRLRIVNLGGRPWLVAFRNLTDDVTDVSGNNFDPIAADVEAFQVAFALNRAKPSLTCCQTAPDGAGNSNWIIGDAPAEAIFAQPANVLTTQPDYRASYDAPSRYALHPANIRAVHLSVVMRSSRVEPTKRRTSQLVSIFNWTAPASTPDGFYRSIFHTVINTPNTMSRTFFLPALRTAADTRDLNSWGG